MEEKQEEKTIVELQKLGEAGKKELRKRLHDHPNFDARYDELRLHLIADELIVMCAEEKDRKFLLDTLIMLLSHQYGRIDREVKEGQLMDIVNHLAIRKIEDETYFPYFKIKHGFTQWAEAYDKAIEANSTFNSSLMLSKKSL